MTDTEKGELLVRLAENVLGGKLTSQYDGLKLWRRSFELPSGELIDVKIGGVSKSWNPIETLTDAWMLVEALRSIGWDFELRAGCCGSEWLAEFQTVTDDLFFPRHQRRASTPALAICLASEAATREVKHAE